MPGPPKPELPQGIIENMMSRTGIIFPHQLFERSPLAGRCSVIYLVEEWLYFRQYPFHQQKIAYQRAGMKWYEDHLRRKGIQVIYIEAFSGLEDVRRLIAHLKSTGVDAFEYIDTTDDWLERRIGAACRENGVEAIKHPTQQFLNTPEELEAYFTKRSRFFQADFYRHQRLSRKLLLEGNQRPLGGKWSFDEENRARYPKGQKPPVISFPQADEVSEEAIAYTRKFFGANYGSLQGGLLYPFTFESARAWLAAFLKARFSAFGTYEDAIVAGEHFLHHSVLTPMLNTGLLTPGYVLEEVLDYAASQAIPLNSLEGFIRQLVGWREFIRAVYQLKGREERTRNYWGFTRKIPPAFWEGTTGILPVDLTIKKVLRTGYCHHIERLMVLGNFMLLCEFDPDEVYRWFMELFIDAYDWVMVPNVYGMSQFADGGLMATKPYISGSNYLLKMGDYPKGSWQGVWDGLFWRFMHTHRSFFLQNPRLGMLVGTFDKMSQEKRQAHLETAERFLDTL
jgi:deoxyribodipyrimidine photolyase-related protein